MLNEANEKNEILRISAHMGLTCLCADCLSKIGVSPESTDVTLEFKSIEGTLKQAEFTSGENMSKESICEYGDCLNHAPYILLAEGVRDVNT